MKLLCAVAALFLTLATGGEGHLKTAGLKTGHYNGRDTQTETGLVAHEWGTFTCIAGNEGAAVEWYSWAVPSDLPNFVEHFQSRNFKPNRSGTIRMETPVLYFYSPSETKVSVHVSFSQGLITEWHPHVTRFTARDASRGVRFSAREESGSVTWASVTS